MSRDGDDVKEPRQRKSSPKHKGTEFGDRLMPKRRHPAIYVGIAFAILGGLMITSTFLVSWVDSFDNITDSLVKQLFVLDLADVREWGSIYYLALLTPIVGATCAVLSSMALVKDKRTKLRQFSAMGVLLTSMMVSVLVIALIWLLKENYISEQLNRSIYGPAIFLSVFGCVLAVAGGIVLSVDYVQSERNKGALITAAGSKHLRTALRPVKRGRPSKRREFHDNESQDFEIRDEMLAEQKKPEGAQDEEGLSCPNCQSPVKANWKLCPVCGTELD